VEIKDAVVVRVEVGDTGNPTRKNDAANKDVPVAWVVPLQNRYFYVANNLLVVPNIRRHNREIDPVDPFFFGEKFGFSIFVAHPHNIRKGGF